MTLISSSSLRCSAAESRFIVFWMRNTIRNVNTVVPVLITSCQVLENPKIGPETAHPTTMTIAAKNATEWPAQRETRDANRSK